jgi:hypothetical protein
MGRHEHFPAAPTHNARTVLFWLGGCKMLLHHFGVVHWNHLLEGRANYISGKKTDNTLCDRRNLAAKNRPA